MKAPRKQAAPARTQVRILFTSLRVSSLLFT